jgi:hypothetical protein
LTAGTLRTHPPVANILAAAAGIVPCRAAPRRVVPNPFKRALKRAYKVVQSAYKVPTKWHKVPTKWYEVPTKWYKVPTKWHGVDCALDCALDCARTVGWAGPGWAGLGWAGLGWAGLGWAAVRTGLCDGGVDKLAHLEVLHLHAGVVGEASRVVGTHFGNASMYVAAYYKRSPRVRKAASASHRRRGSLMPRCSGWRRAHALLCYR